MKNRILASLLLITSGSTAIAQQSTLVSIGGGISNSSSDTKNKAYTGNGYNLQADVFIPFLYGSRNAAGKFSFGVIAGGSYYSSKNLTPDAAGTQAAYKTYNGQLDVTSEKGGASNNGFTATAGLQAAVALGKLSVSPSFSGGYFSLKQKGFVQQAMINAKPVALAGSPETKQTGFMLVPQVRISYPVATNLYLYASTALLMGPQISTQQMTLVPAGGVNDQHTYEQSQLSGGKMQSNTVQANYRALNINAGISFGFGNSAKREVKNPLYNGGGASGDNPLHKASVAMPGSPIGGIVVKGGKNPGGNMLVITTDQNGGFELTGLETGSYQFRLTAPDQPQEKSINEKGVKRADASAFASPGQPIGGIVVKGGKNPGGNMTNLSVSNDGMIRFDVLEAGNYKFIIQTPGEPAQQKTKKVKEKATSGLKDTLKTNV
jgi:hypothetical protein